MGADAASVASRPAAAAAPVDALRQLARQAGNRATARLLQRWVDQDGKTYPGDQPADSENWERFDHSGQQRWRPKTAAAAPVATVVETVEAKPVTATATVKKAEPVKNTTESAGDDSTTVWWANPATIRYSQNSISPKFANGTKIGDAARSLKKSPSKVEEFPALLLRGRKSGKHVSLDNRRLWVFKHAQVPLCKVRWASEDEWEAQKKKMTAGSDGSAFIGVTGIRPDMKDLPTFTPPASYKRTPNTHYV